MENEIIQMIFGYIAFVGGLIAIFFVIFDKIKKIIKSRNYKTAIATVVNYIDMNSDESIKKQQEELKVKNPKIYNIIMPIYQKITNSEYSDCKNKEPSYLAVYEYIVNGKKYLINDTIGTDFKGKLGIKRKIKYNIKNPKESLFVKDWSHIGIILILLIFVFIGYAIINY